MYCMCSIYTSVACDADYYKEEVGNVACEMCPPQQVPTADRTGCECAEGSSGTNCMGEFIYIIIYTQDV